MQDTQRRSFLRRFTAAAVGFGPAMLAEAQGCGVNSCVAGVAEAPTSTPLSLLRTNQLYQASLAHGDVALLLSRLPEMARLDPPVEASARVLADVSTESVKMPVVSYATQRVIAFVHFGTAVAKGATMPLRALVQPDGKMTMALNGVAAVSTRLDYAIAAKALHFPERFIADLAAAPDVASSMRRVSGRQGGWRMQRTGVGLPEADVLDLCEIEAKNKFDACIRGALNTMFMFDVFLLVCALLVLASIGFFGPASVIAWPATLVACGMTVAQLLILDNTCRGCREQFANDREICRLKRGRRG